MRGDRSADRPLSFRDVVGFTGPFGCGKTEVAIAYALAALAQGRASCIVDLDIVTPYFRVGDHREQLGERGLRVVAPRGPLASFELPALPPEIAGAIGDDDLHVVLDVGGDPVGSQLLGVYAPQIASRGYDLWMVANAFRPSSATPALLAEQARAIEDSCPLRLTGIVANPHLGTLTDRTHLEAGWQVAQEAAKQLALPVVFLALEERLVGVAPASEVPVLPFSRMLRLPWESRRSGRNEGGENEGTTHVEDEGTGHDHRR
jgi:hypothetical protein